MIHTKRVRWQFLNAFLQELIIDRSKFLGID